MNEERLSTCFLENTGKCSSTDKGDIDTGLSTGYVLMYGWISIDGFIRKMLRERPRLGEVRMVAARLTRGRYYHWNLGYQRGHRDQTDHRQSNRLRWS